jgi:hypothetical protein
MTCATPTFGWMVVNGTLDIFTSIMVMALNMLDLPELGLPTIPTITSKRPKKKLWIEI